MQSFHSLNLATRLATVFGAIITIFVAAVGVALFNTARLADAEHWNTHTHKVMKLAQENLTAMVNMETGARGFLLAGTDNFLEPWNGGQAEFEKSWNEAKQLTSDNPAQQKRLDAMKVRRDEFVAVGQSLIQVRRAVKPGDGSMDAFVTEFAKGRDKTAMDAYRALNKEFYDTEAQLLVVRAKIAEDSRDTMTLTLQGGLVLAIVAAAGLGLALTRSVLRQLGGEPVQAAGVAKAIAEGGLATAVRLKGGDTTSLMAQLSVMQRDLARVVGNVRHNAESVATASAQIAQGNQDLSSRTEQQASALQQTAATMEELGTTVRGNADSAKQANQLAQSASNVAAQGGQVVDKVVTTMQGINESSRKIGDIIGTIDGIAFQTNILALNAAVEAARAGEQGRGFAVVAAEVRSLAQRSAEAAKEIKSLIGRSVEQVEQGTSLVDEAGKTMSEIVSSIQRVSDIVAEISAASVEQSSGVSQVGEAVTQMDQATQQNAALVEESAAAAQSMQQQAEQLVRTVAVFKLAPNAA
jgi:methyl-accepting chemotaxis protein